MAERIAGVLGLVWAVAVVLLPGFAAQPFIPINLALIYAFLPGGIVLALMVGWERLTGGECGALRDAVLQMGLALLLWPFAITVLGAVTVIFMGLAMGFALAMMWIGACLLPPLAGFGWWAAFGTTCFSVLWSGWKLLA